MKMSDKTCRKLWKHLLCLKYTYSSTQGTADITKMRGHKQVNIISDLYCCSCVNDDCFPRGQ